MFVCSDARCAWQTNATHAGGNGYGSICSGDGSCAGRESDAESNSGTVSESQSESDGESDSSAESNADRTGTESDANSNARRTGAESDSNPVAGRTSAESESESDSNSEPESSTIVGTQSPDKTTKGHRLS